MRALCFALLLLAGCAPAAEGARGGIVSLNPCADQLLVALVPPDKIAAISHYSQAPGATSLPLAVARRFRATAGTAEEVIALAPDLVLATSFTPPATRAAFARAGLRTLYLGSPTTIAASQAQVVEVATAVGAEARGSALNRRIDAAVAAQRADQAGVPALLYISGNLANGGGTLLTQLMALTGFRNAAVDHGLTVTGTLPVETLLARPPAVILSPDAGGRTAALRRRLLARTGARVREVAFPRALINCGGPTIPAALARLRAIRAQVAA
ncbi:iron complex transport system substrate-binding protein [Sphingomonas guangdongensis]|uniref:Iron complex transport system substrate-binding protein n=1 Tax=Sphingomonas guangdongensis TaxID=1141890 RepID=A0A285QX97_9SPHN|nr:ABC transporter substrate-binding protein [Sphingomonas guangdongensis]SOB86543.1 iron complex transport system substrate-binding protein [Sphingomonas guangdongensis]